MCVSKLRRHWFRLRLLCIRADHKFAPSQWETALQSNDVSHWLGANLESALCIIVSDSVPEYYLYSCWLTANWTVNNNINWMNYNQNMQRFSFKNIYSKMSSAKYRPFCSDLDMLRWAWLSERYRYPDRYPHFPSCAGEPPRGVWRWEPLSCWVCLCLTENEGLAPSMGLICRDGLYDRRYIRTRLHDTVISHLDFIDRSSLAATFGSLTQTVHQAQYLLSSCCGIDSESLFALVGNLSNLLERFDFVADW